jgi:hypothetical protein
VLDAPCATIRQNLRGGRNHIPTTGIAKKSAAENGTRGIPDARPFSAADFIAIRFPNSEFSPRRACHGSLARGA